MAYIQRHDRVKAIDGFYKGNHGYVSRIDGDLASVIFKDVWEFGIWVPVTILKRTKRYKKENGKKG